MPRRGGGGCRRGGGFRRGPVMRGPAFRRPPVVMRRPVVVHRPYYGYRRPVVVAPPIYGGGYAPPPVVVNRPVVVQQQAPTVIQSQSPAPPAPGMQRVRITVPPSVSAGQQFKVNFGGNAFNVSCPPNARGGQSILIDIPVVAPPPVAQGTVAQQGRSMMQQAYPQQAPAPPVQQQQQQYAPPAQQQQQQYAPPAQQQQQQYAPPPAPPPVPAPRAASRTPAPAPAPPPASQPSGTVVVVSIPQGITEGKEFIIEHGGREYTIACPAGVKAGDDIEVEL